jgi:hypothetical protein
MESGRLRPRGCHIVSPAAAGVSNTTAICSFWHDYALRLACVSDCGLHLSFGGGMAPLP